MAKISNQNAYPPINPTLEDYVVITDKDNQLLTKTTTLRDIRGLFEQELTQANISIGGTTGINLPTYGNPVELIPAPGPDKVLQVISVFQYLKAGSVPYNYGSLGDLDYKVGSGTTSYDTLFSISDIKINSTIDLTWQNNTVSVKAPETNQPLTLVQPNSGQDYTEGNGVLNINVKYEIIDLEALFG